MNADSRTFWAHAWQVMMSPNDFISIADLHRAYERMQGEPVSGPVLTWKLYEGRQR